MNGATANSSPKINIFFTATSWLVELSWGQREATCSVPHRCYHRFAGRGCPGGTAGVVLRLWGHGIRPLATSRCPGGVVVVGAGRVVSGHRGAVRPPTPAHGPR